MNEINEQGSDWLRCLVAASFKEGEALVRIHAEEVPNPEVAFFVDSRLVRPPSLTADEVEGQVHVTLIERRNGTAVVEVPGEPISFGPKVVVPSSDLS